MRSALEKAKGRRERGSFAQIPANVLQSPEFHGITGEAVRLLLALAAQYNGHNNGNLCAALSVARQYGFKSGDTLARAIAGLIEAGLIIRTREGMFNGAGSKCALFAIAWKAIDPCPGKDLTVAPTKAPPRLFVPAAKQNALSENRTHATPKTGAGPPCI